MRSVDAILEDIGRCPDGGPDTLVQIPWRELVALRAHFHEEGAKLAEIGRLRVEALHAAIHDGSSAGDTVRRAEEYLQFLMGRPAAVRPAEFKLFPVPGGDAA